MLFTTKKRKKSIENKELNMVINKLLTIYC